MVWHAVLWVSMRRYYINVNLVRIFEQLCDKATSAVKMNSSTREWFRTAAKVMQRCLLSPTLMNTFLERVMTDALEEHDGKVGMGCRNISNLRFTNEIDTFAEEEQDLKASKIPAQDIRRRSVLRRPN